MSQVTPPDPDALPRLQALLLRADPAQVSDVLGAIDASQEALALARALSREDDAARAGVWLARHRVHHGDYQEAMDSGLEALRALPSQGAVGLRVMALQSVLLSASELLRFDLALSAGEEMMRITAEGDDASAAMRALVAMAMCFNRMGNGWQGARLLSQALERDTGAPPPVVMMANNELCAVCNHLAHSLRDIGAEGERERFIALGCAAGERARTLLTEPANPAHAATVLANLGMILLARGDATQAEPCLSRALTIATEHDFEHIREASQAHLNEVLLLQGRTTEAADAMQRLVTQMASNGRPASVTVLDVAYRACEAAGRHAEALHHFKAAEQERRRVMTEQMRAQSGLFVSRIEADQSRLRAEHAQQNAAHERERAAVFAADAERDPLTGLGNRRQLDRRSAELLPGLQQGSRPLVLAQIDVDHFKQVNDRHGHAAGDTVLVALAQLLRENMRTNDGGGAPWRRRVCRHPAQHAAGASDRHLRAAARTRAGAPLFVARWFVTCRDDQHRHRRRSALCVGHPDAAGRRGAVRRQARWAQSAAGGPCCKRWPATLKPAPPASPSVSESKGQRGHAPMAPERL